MCAYVWECVRACVCELENQLDAINLVIYLLSSEKKNGLLMKLGVWCWFFDLNCDICGFIWIFCAFKFVGSSAVQTSNIMGECHDMHGQTIEQGRHYVPGPDICKYALISIASTECSTFTLFSIKKITLFFILFLSSKALHLWQWSRQGM